MQSVWRWRLCCSDWTEPQHIRNQSQTPRAQPGYGADGAHVWWTTRGYPALSGQPLSHCRDVPWAYSWHQGLVTQKHFTIKKCVQTFLSMFKGKLRKLQIYWGNPIVWWSAPLSHSKKVLGLNPPSHSNSLSVWILECACSPAFW